MSAASVEALRIDVVVLLEMMIERHAGDVRAAALKALNLIRLMQAQITDLRAEPDAQLRAALESLMNGDADHASFLLAKAIDARIERK